MSTLDPAVSRPPAVAISGALRLAPLLYAATLFLSALLVFAVQPMFTKMVLPRLGGAPTVWSVAMVFFQTALLAGYVYAHLLVRFVPLGIGALAHFGVLAVAALALPIGIAHGFDVPPATDIAPWLIGLFAVSIGLPFAVLSASAPLLQAWFAATGHPQAHNPYVLYAASNLGSFSALIAYPILIEPLLPLRSQTQLWAAGYAVLAVMIAVASSFIAQRPRIAAVATDGAAPSWRDRLAWMALSAIPAGLVIAVTSYLTTDVAAAPFLWVLPLALYLLTFVAVFRERPWIANESVARAVPFMVAPLAIGLIGRDHVFWLAMVAINLIAFVLLALVCHGRLYRLRPSPARLTEFYLLVSLGGVIGGIFAALIAPQIFSRVYEYPILIAAGVLALPGLWSGGLRRILVDAGLILLVATLAVLAQIKFSIRLPAVAELPFQIALVVLAAIMLLQRERPARFFAWVVLGFVLTALWQPGYNSVETARSFFGVHQVVETSDGGIGCSITAQPCTAPSACSIAMCRPMRRRSRSPTIISADRCRRPSRQRGRRGRACARRGGGARYRQPRLPQARQRGLDLFRDRSRGGAHRPRSKIVHFPLGLRARRSDRARRCTAHARGLATALRRHRHRRLFLGRDPGSPADARGLTGYLSRLEKGGVIVMHISNRHMELDRVVAAVGAAEGLVSYIKQDNRPEIVPPDYKSNAIVVALTRDPANLGNLPKLSGWRRLAPDPRVPAWTDDYSDIVGAILRKKLGW